MLIRNSSLICLFENTPNAKSVACGISDEQTAWVGDGNNSGGVTRDAGGIGHLKLRAGWEDTAGSGAGRDSL